ncbi:hypothetical protein AVEN_55336-1 [Araneus ventricosus]|uniref:Uncharacterized protein n=1 Tax=Araneus ventricosus TaxID=182803 RepID=A0A4Y2DCE0_ARAVE|nr:hypothetical protein AVEN_55336-1 [Araneus ventricosus]
MSPQPQKSLFLILNRLRYVGNGQWPVTDIIFGLCQGEGVTLTLGRTLTMYDSTTYKDVVMAPNLISQIVSAHPYTLCDKKITGVFMSQQNNKHSKHKWRMLVHVSTPLHLLIVSKCQD